MRRHGLPGLLFAAVFSLSNEVGATARFAIVIGANQGPASVPALRYADKDAERFAQSLIQRCRFPADQILVLKDPQLTDLEGAFDAMDRRLLQARDRGESPLLIVYFSGHGDSDGLSLGSDGLSFAKLRTLLKNAPAETKVAIVDSCNSGALLATKRARPVAAPGFSLTPDDSVHGLVIITSSADGENAEESSALEGSFFTSYLNAALWGAGDLDGDGRVTVDEAYRYASAETRAVTAGMPDGGQHPSYEMQLSGRGDLVLSDLRRAEARLLLPARQGATYVVRGPHEFVAEVPGARAVVSLALPAGQYHVERRLLNGQRAATDVQLIRDATVALPALHLIPHDETSAKRGGPIMELFAGGGLWDGMLNTIGGGAYLGGLHPAFGQRIVWRVDYLQSRAENVSGPDGPEFTLYAVRAAAGVLFRVGPSSWPIRFDIGPEAGVGWTLQRLSTGSVSQALGGQFAAVGQASHVFGRFSAGIEVAATAELLFLDGSLAARPETEISLFTSVGL